MNQDQVIEKLLQLDDTVEDFIVTFSGKSSKKVDGLYKPDDREIILHNKNFEENDNALIYTAIHEFAHHIQFTTSAAPVSARAHTNHFWNIFHKLLGSAEEKGIYKNIFEVEDDFIELTKRIKKDFLHINGKMMRDLGNLLIQAHETCIKHHASFDDYMDRVLGLHRSVAKTIMKTETLNINPEIGYENMKTVASIKDEGIRQLAEAAFVEGQSPDMVKAKFTARKQPDDKMEYLLTERDRLEKSLETITVKLAKIEIEIDDLK